MGRKRYGGKRSYSTGSTRPRFRSGSSAKSSPKPAKDKGEKAPPPKKVETTHGGSNSERFRSSIADGEKAPPPKKVETTHGGSNSGRSRSSIADGFIWGAGNAMGHRFVEAIFGPRTIEQEIVLPKTVKEVATVSAKDDHEKLKDYSETCSISYNAFQDCLNVEGNNLSKCHLFMDSLFECRRNSSSFNF